MLGLSALMGAQVPPRRALEILELQGNPWMKERVAAAVEAVLQGISVKLCGMNHF